MSRLAEPQLSFADVELRHQGVHLDPQLQGILTFLDDQATLIEQVRQDLVRGLKKPDTGRTGITPSQTLRSLILMRVKNWDYRELRERINDGYTLRTFTDFHSRRVPQHDAFNRAFNRLTPATLQVINQAVVETAVRLGLEDGKRLRVDTTAVESNVHFRMSSEGWRIQRESTPPGQKSEPCSLDGREEGNRIPKVHRQSRPGDGKRVIGP